MSTLPQPDHPQPLGDRAQSGLTPWWAAWICATLVGLALTVLSASPILFPWPYLKPRSQTLPGELAGSSRVCQTIVADYDNLSHVYLKLFDYGRQNTSQFHFYLYDDSDALIAHVIGQASQVQAQNYFDIHFAPVAHSAGRSLRFCLEAPEADLDQSISIWGNLDDTYPQGQVEFYDMWGLNTGIQDLDFRQSYDVSLWQRIMILLQRAAQYKPLLCGSAPFYVFLIAIYLILMYALLFQLLARLSQQH